MLENITARATALEQEAIDNRDKHQMPVVHLTINECLDSAAAIRALVEYIAAQEDHQRELARGEHGASDRFDTWLPLQKAYFKLKALNDGLGV